MMLADLPAVLFLLFVVSGGGTALWWATIR